MTTPTTSATSHAYLRQFCHLVRAKLLSMATSNSQVTATTAIATGMDAGESQMKNMHTHMRNSTLSHQCMTSILASVRPVISVVMPFSSSWCA